MATTPWLDPDEQRAWRTYLRMQARLHRQLAQQLQRDAGMSAADFEVLVNLSEADGGRLRAFELGDALQWEKSRLSHHLTRMESRDLVVREECTTDARGAFVRITDQGRAAIEHAAPMHVAEVRARFVDALSTAQLRALEEICETVLATLEEG